ncbi:M20/M25/M40 family metallo-hydrolase [Phenylobacterium sp.]|jgi:hypothetical protein|uniref:M20/M25/M40 family metallo-hydrolase n=1 Tax=Phenylobacterium sp. TaxID=1871053 RepID=UPI002F94AAA7
MGRLLALIGALIVAALIAWAGERPPKPEPATAPATAFSAERAMADVREMARAPHPMGSPENRRVRDYLVGRMAALGLSPAIRVDSAMSHRLREGDVRLSGGQVENIVGVLPGRDRSAPAVALMAHYDSVPGSPGAADDAAGVASALETVRALKAQGTPARDVMVLITDGEESGLLGARAFFERDPLAKRVGLILNMEARGNGGRVQMFETSPGNGPLIELFRKSAVRPASSSLSVFIYETMPNDTDFSVPKKLGFQGLNYAFIGRQFDYHSPTSTPANLDRGSLQDMGTQVLAATRAAANAQALPAKGEDAVYSQLFGDVTLAHPAWVGWLVLAAAAGLIAVAVQRSRRKETFPWTDALRGAGAFVVAVLGSATVLHFARKASGAGMGYFDQRFLLAQITRWETACILLALGFLILAACELARGRRNIALVPLAAGIGSSLFGGFDPIALGMGVVTALIAVAAYGRPVSRPGGWTGVLAMGLLLSVAAQAFAPAAAYQLSWPLLIAALGAAVTAGAAYRGLPSIVVLAAGATAGLAWLGGTAHVLFLGLDMPQLLAFPVALAALLVWPLAQPEEGAPPARLVSHLLLGAGFALLIAVRLNDPWDARHPQASHVLYQVDQDAGQAWRISQYVGLTPWTRRVLADDGGALAKHRHWLDLPLSAAPARAVSLPPPALALAKAADGALLLTVTPPPGGREVALQLRANTPVRIEQVAGLAADLAQKPGGWARVNWEAAPQPLTLRLRPAGPGALDVRYAVTIDGWPKGAKPLPARPADEMAFHTSDSTLLTGTRRFTW